MTRAWAMEKLKYILKMERCIVIYMSTSSELQNYVTFCKGDDFMVEVRYDALDEFLGKTDDVYENVGDKMVNLKIKIKVEWHVNQD